MDLTPMPVTGAYRVDFPVSSDDRGTFRRLYCRDTFDHAGVSFPIAQVSLSSNRCAGTLRGLHYQMTPHSEQKLIRCIRGRAFDVLVDLRPGSPTYGRSAWTELDGESDSGPEAVYVPEGVAHGFLTLTDRTDLLYLISRPYEPTAAAGIRWNDPGIEVPWPSVPRVMSERDATFPDHSW